jgi:6-phosphogluconate dehydrogenase
VWVMVPSGSVTDRVVTDLASRLEAGDTVIDGGNSYFKDDLRHSHELAGNGITFLDAGTSGGVWGLERGYCLMIGGPRDAYERLEPIFASLAPGVDGAPRTPGRDGAPAPEEQGYLYCGPVGSGHFVKMVHNGIEYGVMEAYAEGLDVLAGAAQDSVPEEIRYDIDLAAVTEVWRRGSVIGSWLLDLTAGALHEDPKLAAFEGRVHDSGEGRWTVDAAVEEGVAAPAIAAALFARFRSQHDHTFGEKALSAMRHAFGGHSERPGQGKTR